METEKEMDAKYRGMLVCHTHWDREWYMSFQAFRKWLVTMIDDLLDNFPRNPTFHSFLLDGQTIILDDYLEIRPERMGELLKLLKAKKLIIGPFYVLADEFIASGETLIRNLLIGHKMCAAIGVDPMRVGYVPDTFGHIWQLPQILQGFGIPFMYYFRGYPPLFGNHEEYAGKNDQTSLEHYYTAPDGSQVLAFHHIIGYGSSSHFCDNLDSSNPDFPYIFATIRMAGTFEKVVPRLQSKLVLFTNGDDHRQAEWLIPDFITKWNKNDEFQEDMPVLFEQTTIEAYFKALQQEVQKGLKLPTLSGEARGSMYTQVTAGVLSTRMNLKLFNWKVTQLLEKYAEPFATLLWTLGAQYPNSYLEIAWKQLLQNEPHDSICGCHLDRVQKDMMARYNTAFDNVQDIQNYAFATILAGINRSAFIQKMTPALKLDPTKGNVHLLGIFNPNPFSIPSVIEDYVSLLPEHVYRMYDADGTEIKSIYFEYIPDYRQQNPQRGQYLYKRFQMNWSLGRLFGIFDKIPPCGYKIFYLVGTPQKTPRESPHPWIPTPLKTKSNIISFNANGTINIECLTLHQRFEHLNLFEDCADDGDTYDFGPLANDKVLTTAFNGAKFTKVRESPIFTEIKAEIEFSIPFQLIGDADSKRFRSDRKITLALATTYRIYNELDRIDITTNVTNRAKGHRLRVLFPTNISATHSYADDHFMVMKRSITLPNDNGWYQDMQGIYHQDTFVDLYNDQSPEAQQCGLAIFNHGTPEFEIIPSPTDLNQNGHSIAMTLFRSVAWLSQKGHQGRKSGLNGPNLQTPGAQLMNHQFEFEYAIFPHQGNWQIGQVYREAYSYNAPPRVFSEPHSLRNEKLPQSLPSTNSFFALTNSNVMLSALKRSEQIQSASDGIIIRIFNPSDQQQTTILKFSWSIARIIVVNLLEQDLELVPLKNDHDVELSLEPYKIVTLRIEPK